MKMTPVHYDTLKAMIEPNKGKIAAHREVIVKEGKAKDVEQRLRWDLLWAIPSATRTPFIDECYKYMNDDHLDTALRSIVREFESSPVPLQS